MPRKKVELEVDEDEDEDEEEEDEEDELEANERDFVMARVGAALASAQAAVDALTEALILFVQPEEDKSGKKRDDLIDSAQEALGAASTSLEVAEGIEYDPKEGEPEADQ